jgi:hypothetical protein
MGAAGHHDVADADPAADEHQQAVAGAKSRQHRFTPDDDRPQRQLAH